MKQDWACGRCGKRGPPKKVVDDDSLGYWKGTSVYGEPDRIEGLRQQHFLPDKKQVSGGSIYCSHLGIDQTPAFGAYKVAEINASSFRRAEHVIDEMTAIGKELRTPVICLLW